MPCFRWFGRLGGLPGREMVSKGYRGSRSQERMMVRWMTLVEAEPETKRRLREAFSGRLSRAG